MMMMIFSLTVKAFIVSSTIFDNMAIQKTLETTFFFSQNFLPYGNVCNIFRFIAVMNFSAKHAISSRGFLNTN